MKQTEEKSSPASDEVDLFASDDEATEAPVRVEPAPKAKAEKKPEAAPKKVAAEAPAWPNKAECNDAETKFQEELSKVATCSLLVFQCPDLCPSRVDRFHPECTFMFVSKIYRFRTESGGSQEQSLWRENIHHAQARRSPEGSGW